MGSSGSIISSGGAANALVVRKFPWTATTPGLFVPGTGWSFYTGASGDLLHDFWVELDAVTGSTPAQLDIFTATTGSGFLRDWSSLHAMDISSATSPITTGSGSRPGMAWYPVSGAVASFGGAYAEWGAVAAGAWGLDSSSAANVAAGGSPPVRWTAAQPLIAVVTQTGAMGGAAVTTPAPAHGTIYVLTSTPA